MTPVIREAIKSTSFWLEGRLDFMRTALEVMTVSMAFRPAAFMVSPDSMFVLVNKAELLMRRMEGGCHTN